jgi:hypothetical protein
MLLTLHYSVGLAGQATAVLRGVARRRRCGVSATPILFRAGAWNNSLHGAAGGACLLRPAARGINILCEVNVIVADKKPTGNHAKRSWGLCNNEWPDWAYARGVEQQVVDRGGATLQRRQPTLGWRWKNAGGSVQRTALLLVAEAALR